MMLLGSGGFVRSLNLAGVGALALGGTLAFSGAVGAILGIARLGTSVSSGLGMTLASS